MTATCFDLLIIVIWLRYAVSCVNDHLRVAEIGWFSETSWLSWDNEVVYICHDNEVDMTWHIESCESTWIWFHQWKIVSFEDTWTRTNDPTRFYELCLIFLDSGLRGSGSNASWPELLSETSSVLMASLTSFSEYSWRSPWHHPWSLRSWSNWSSWSTSSWSLLTDFSLISKMPCLRVLIMLISNSEGARFLVILLLNCWGWGSPGGGWIWTSEEKVFNKPQKSPIVHFGERVFAHIQAQPPAQKLHIRSAPQKSFGPWLGKEVITGMHIVSLIDGKILKTRTITRLVSENQFNVEEFKKFKVATHESNVRYQEGSYDQMWFKDLVQNSYLNRRTMSSLSQQNQTLR